MDGVIDMFADLDLPKKKTCGRCLQLLALDSFAKNPCKPDGMSAVCKLCQKFHYKKWERAGDNLQRTSLRRKELRKADPRRFLFNEAKSRAKGLGRAFNISLDDIVIPDRCPVFGELLEVSESHWFAPSVDEKVYGLGYTKGNVQVISRLANAMKHKASPAQLRQFADWVYRTFPNMDTDKRMLESFMLPRSGDEARWTN
jgi:hypothetical protein